MTTTSAAPPSWPHGGRQRCEVRAASRRNLLDAALQILDEEGESALTTTRVANLAGLKQPTFYVHFESIDALFESLIDEVLDGWWAETIAARREARDAPGDRERLRDTFRAPMAQLVAHPQLLRIVLGNRLEPTSTIGVWSRRVYGELCDGLIRDLSIGGFPTAKKAERRRVEMIADAIMAMTAELALGHIDGRYPDIEETVDVLVAFSKGYLTLRPHSPAKKS